MLLKMSLSATVLILVIVVIHAVTINKLPKKTFLVLWGIALFRLFIPFSIPSQFSIYTILNILKNTGTELSVPVFRSEAVTIPGIRTIHSITGNGISAESVQSGAPFLVIWLAGLLVCAAFILTMHLRCRREYKTALPVCSDFVKSWLGKHQIWRTVQIKQSDKISGPITYGILRPVILLPKSTDLTDENLLQYVLMHEYVHIRRFDIVSKWLLAAAVCIHWFNPLVWVMYILANRDLELACDETVVRSFGETAKSCYAMALIGLEEKKNRLTPLCNNFNKNAIEERIVSIMKMKKTSLMGTLLALAIVILTTTAFATTAVEPESDNSKPYTNDIIVAGSVAPKVSMDSSKPNTGDNVEGTANNEVSNQTDKVNNSNETNTDLKMSLTINESKVAADIYKVWLQKQKAYLQEEVALGKLSQKNEEELMNWYESVLTRIENGEEVSVVNDGAGNESISIIPESTEFDVKFSGSGLDKEAIITDKNK
jgi:beta-lactamase regulating signal transducer with metallopeptidase domain